MNAECLSLYVVVPGVLRTGVTVVVLFVSPPLVVISYHYCSIHSVSALVCTDTDRDLYETRWPLDYGNTTAVTALSGRSLCFSTSYSISWNVPVPVLGRFSRERSCRRFGPVECSYHIIVGYTEQKKKSRVSPFLRTSRNTFNFHPFIPSSGNSTSIDHHRTTRTIYTRDPWHTILPPDSRSQVTPHTVSHHRPLQPTLTPRLSWFPSVLSPPPPRRPCFSASEL